MHFMSSSEIADKFPRDALMLIWHPSGLGNFTNLYGVLGTLERLITASPAIEGNHRLQWVAALVTR